MWKTNCNYCWKEFNDYIWSCHAASWENQKNSHEINDCEDNPNNYKWILKSFIFKCQQTAKVFDCLNCKQFQKTCEWTKNNQ